MANRMEIIRPQNLDRFLSELKDRARALQEKVVAELAAEFKASVAAAAPRGGSEAYAQHVALRRVVGKDARFAVLVDEQARAVAELPSETVYSYRALSRKYEALPLLSVLRKYEPFPQDLLPVAVQGKQYRLVFKRVTGDEAARIREKTYAAWREIQTALIGAKVPRELLQSPGVPPATEAVEDLVFRTIRQEFGINANRKPVWLPAIAKFRSGVGLKEILKSKDALRMLSDPDYSEWSRVDTVSETTDETTIKQLDEFQRRILTT